MPIFVVHEHHARNLHFDLRIEMNGVLKSWAVPKGPSMSPADKRLAILVDDHPLEYSSFEGEIPKGSYGAGQVAIWDTGSCMINEGSFETGKIAVEFNGIVLKGVFSLFETRRGRNQWLLIKKRDKYAEGEFQLKTCLPEAK